MTEEKAHMEIGFNENLEPCPLCKSKDVYLDKEINKRLNK